MQQNLLTDDRSPVFVVAVDGSPSSWRALRMASELARCVDATLVLLHVAEPAVPSSFDPAPAWVRAEERARLNGEHVLRVARSLAGEVVAACELHFGDPAAVICRRARELQADLVVVGSRDLGRINRLLLGSVSKTVAAQADCSVLIVRAPEARAWRDDPGVSTIRARAG